MPGAHEKLEHAEHAAHGGGHGGSSKLFGVTMALIGVLIALSGAMVGSERNELTRAMIEQTQAHANWTSASTKFRLIMLELEKQRARVASARDTPGGWSPVERFIELASDYTAERRVAKTWSDSYHPVVEAHFEAAEGYEHAQLIAEVGIVLASLGVLLASRAAWLISVILGVLCLGQLGRTYVPTQRVIQKALVNVRHAEEAFDDLRKGHAGANEDEQVIARLDPDGKMRADIAERAKAHASEAHATETHPAEGKK
jgi:hypothetical protein